MTWRVSVIVDQMTETLQVISASGVGVLLVEQQLRVASAVAATLVVMVNGQIDTIVSAAQLNADPALRQRLLGVG
jgi:branched-chain amino acid transport system ATP-binding protein